MMSSNNNNNNSNSNNNYPNSNGRPGPGGSQMFSSQQIKNEPNVPCGTTSYLHRQLSSGLNNQQQHFHSQNMQGNNNGNNQMQAPSSGGPVCYGCHQAISERFLLRALNQLWHEDCLKCNACECRLGEVGSILYEKANQILCKRDYLRMFGKIGVCDVCKKRIEAFEMVMKVQEKNYHLECFTCSTCNRQFCVGDKFSVVDNRILCEYDSMMSRGRPVTGPKSAMK